MNDEKKLTPFQSKTYTIIKSEYDKLLSMCKTYLVLSDVFNKQFDNVKQLIDNMELSYNKEVTEWLGNPQNTCQHKHLQQKYVRTDDNYDVYELICQDCGKKLGSFKCNAFE